MAKMLEEHWIKVLGGNTSYVRRAIVRAYAAYRRRAAAADALPWLDLGGEG